VKFIADSFRFRINDEIDVAGSQASPAMEETKRKSCRQLKSVNEHVPAPGKELLDPLFNGGGMWNINKVSQGPLLKTGSPFVLDVADCGIDWPTSFDKRGERRQEPFRIPQRYYYRSRFTGKDMIRKTRRHRKVAKRSASGHPADKKGRYEYRENQEQEIVAGVPRGKGYDRDENQKDSTTGRDFNGEIQPAYFEPG